MPVLDRTFLKPTLLQLVDCLTEASALARVKVPKARRPGMRRKARTRPSKASRTRVNYLTPPA